MAEHTAKDTADTEVTEITKEAFMAALVARHGEENQARLARARVGIAGLGGLGSAVALHLARLGVGTLVLVDHDVVDVTNLHRQQYALDQVGMAKSVALAEELRAINPFIAIESHETKVDAANASELFAGCDIVCEAFDLPDQKAMLVETVLTELPDAKVVSGSGMAGFSSANSIQTTRALERLYLCGDGGSDVAEGGTLMSPRVGVCAGHQANMIARLILGEVEP